MSKKRKSVRTKRKDSWILFIRRKFFLISALAVSALFFAGQISITQDYRATDGILGETTTYTGTNQFYPTGYPTVRPVSKVETNSDVPRTTRTTKTSQSPKFQYKYVVNEGKTSLVVEDSNGHKISTAEATRRELETEMEDRGVEVSSSDGEFTFGRTNTQAISHFPLAVNPDTHELTVTTPAGTKTVTVLPDAAVNNFLVHEKVPATTSATPTATGSGFGRFLGDHPSVTINSVDLKLKNNDLIYQVQSQKQGKLFGLIPVAIDTTTSVSAENGQVVSETETALGRLVNLFLR